MGVDLSLDPEAVNVNPGDARRIAEINRLRPVPKPSTTSYATTGDGGVTPMRADDIEKRRAAIHAIQNPPEDAVQKRWDAHEKHWQEIDRRAEQHQQDQQAALRQADERRLAEVNRQLELKRKRQEFANAEATIDLCLADLTLQERGRVIKRLLNAGRVHDADLAMLYAAEEKLARDNGTVDDTSQADWRGIIKKKR